MTTEINPGTHNWTGSAGQLKRCSIPACRKWTNGTVKPVTHGGRKKPLCSDCALARGFKR